MKDKEVHTFSKGISPKVNVLAWLEFELASFETSVMLFSHFATLTLLFIDTVSALLSFVINNTK